MAQIAVVNVRDIAAIGGAACKRVGGGLPANHWDLENLKLCRRLHGRMTKGDYRMTEREYSRLIEACNWLLRQDRLNKGQPDKAPIEEESTTIVWSKWPLPKGTYNGIVRRIADGTIDAVAHE
jgi:hypothetical protein